MKPAKVVSIMFIILAVTILSGCREKQEESYLTSLGTEAAGSVSGEKSGYTDRITKAGFPPDCLIAVSWNAYKFGRSKSNDEIIFMAGLLKEADIVALQEVSTSDFGAQAVARLSDELNRLGSKWDYIVSDATHESDAKERYAFLWKTSRINATPRRAILYGELSGKLGREPAKVDFRVDDKWSLTVVNFHLAPTTKKPERELIALAKAANLFPEERVIFMGDFNLSRRKLSPVFEGIFGSQVWINGKTSLKSKPGQSGTYLSHEYDNIFTRGALEVFRSAIVDFVPQFPDLKQARAISDHLPVYILFKFSD